MGVLKLFFVPHILDVLPHSNVCRIVSALSLHLKAAPNLSFLCKYKNDPFIMRGYKHKRLICFIAYKLD